MNKKNIRELNRTLADTIKAMIHFGLALNKLEEDIKKGRKEK